MPIMSKHRGPIRGKAAKAKGSRAERKVRDAIRSIYPPSLRSRVQRVPLSGAGAVKGDVMDLNDVDSMYEVKCQETLCLNEWWRQAKSQAGTTCTPILVITQSYRPYYYILKEKDWDALRDASEYKNFCHQKHAKHPKGLMDKLAELEGNEVMAMEIDSDQCCIVPEDYYLRVKRDLYRIDNPTEKE